MNSYGRRWRRHPLTLGVAAAMAVPTVVLVSVSAVAAESESEVALDIAGAAQCELAELPYPDDAVYGFAYAVSPSGEFVAGTFNTEPVETNREAILWRDGEPLSLQMPGFAKAEGVNDSGVVVGYGIDDWEVYPYVEADGEVTQVPGVEFGRAYSVNSDGDVAGQRLDTRLKGEPFVWRPGAEEAETLPLHDDGAHEGSAQDIGDDGTVVGWYEAAEREIRPYAWDADGSGRELPMPADPDPDHPDVYALQVAGDWAVGTNGADALRWDLTGDEAPEVLELDRANDVNGEGHVAGTVGNQAVLLTDDGLVELPSLGTYPRPATASGVSADGQTVSGYVDHPDTAGNVPAVWHC